MHWRIEIAGDPHDLRMLADAFTEDWLQIVEEREKFFLLSTDFASDANASEINDKAGTLLAILNGAARLALRGRTPIVSAGPERIRDDGQREVFLFAEATVEVRAFAHLTVRDAAGNVIHQSKPADSVPSWIELGRTTSGVSKALRLYGQAQHDWVSLYRIYEVIKEDVGTQLIYAEGWVTKAAITNFSRTANHPEAAGDAARHGATNDQPPPNPMALSEACAIIELLLHRWLDYKANPTSID